MNLLPLSTGISCYDKENIDMYTNILNTGLNIFPKTAAMFAKQTPISMPSGSRRYHVLWVNDGEMSLTINNSTYTLKKNEGIFFCKGIPVKYCSADEQELTTSWVTFKGGDQLVEYCGIAEYLLFNCPDDMNEKAQKLHDFIIQDNPDLLKSAETYKWVAELLNCIAKRTPGVSEKTRTYLYQNFFKPLSLDDIAAAVGMNKFTLCRIYKNETGNHIINDLKIIRCKKAMHLLVHTTMSIDEIGHICGYSDSNYFSKNFKSQMGCPPSEYRKKAQIQK